MVMIAALFAMASIGATPAGISVPDIVEVTDLSGLKSSPDGRLVAFRTDHATIDDNGARMAWFVMPTDRGARPRRIADGGDALFTDAGMLATQMPVWSPDSTALYFRALIDGQDQVWRAPIDGSGAVEVSHDAANVRDFSIAKDGRSLTYQVGATRADIDAAEQHSHDDGVLVDASVDIAQPVSRGAMIDGRLASQRLTGHWFAHDDILWQTPRRSVTIALLPLDTQSRFGGLRYSPAPTAASPAPARAVLQSDGNNSRLELDRAGAAPILCAAALCRSGHLTSAVALDDNRSVLFTTSDAVQAQSLWVWDSIKASARRLRTVAGLLSGDREAETPCAVTPMSLVCVESAAAAPPRLVSIALSNGAATVAFDPNAVLRARIATPVRALQWRDANGTSFSGQLFLPVTPAPKSGFPLVMNYYDCAGFLRGGIGDELPMLPLASQGIAVLCINQVHNPVAAADTAEWDYQTALSGIRAILDTLGHDKLIDRDRVGMWGLSFGSEIAIMVAMRSQLLSAVSVSTGLAEPGLYWFNAVAGRDFPDQMKSHWRVDRPDRDLAGWKRISPALNADSLRAPLLMQLAEQEARWSMQLYATLSRSTTPVEMYAFANEAHIKEQPRHRLAAYQRNLDWFRFWLQGYADPAPDKAARYARWRALSARRSAAPVIADRARP